MEAESGTRGPADVDGGAEGFPPPGVGGEDDPSDPARTVILEEVPEFTARVEVPGRRIVLLPAVSGVDTTGTTAGLALALASVREFDVLLLDADSALPGTGLSTRFGLHAALPGAMMPVAPGLTYRSTPPEDLVLSWPTRYGIVLVHCGPGPSRDVLDEALLLADEILLLTPESDAGFEAAAAALDWLGESGRTYLVGATTVVVASGGGEVVVEESLAERCAAVHRLPPGTHSLGPGVLDPALMPPAAQNALAGLAGEVAADA